MGGTEKRYVVVSAIGGKPRVVASTDDRKEAQAAMRKAGGISAVKTRSGRTLDTTIARSIG